MLLFGLAGWLSTREKKIATKATWESKVDTKLDFINSGITGACSDIKSIQTTLNEHGSILIAHKDEIKRAHQRIDEITKKN